MLTAEREVPTAMEVAERLAACYRRLESPSEDLYAETVLVTHEPAVPHFDGPWPREKLAEHGRNELAMWRKLMPDFRYEDVRTETLPNGFSLSLRLVGTPTKGPPIDVPITTHNEVADGRIRSTSAQLDPGAVGALMALMQS